MGSEGRRRGSAAMQAPFEVAGGAAGAVGGGAEDPGAQGGPGGPNAQGAPNIQGAPNAQGGPDAQGGPGGPAVQGGPGGPDAEGGPGGPNADDDPDAQAAANGQGGPGGPGGPRGPCRERGEGRPAGGAPRAVRARQASGPGGDAAAGAAAAPVPGGGPGNRQLLEFTLTVPFRSPLEAEMARRSLFPIAQLQTQGIQEFTLNGSTLSVRWTAEDPVLFRISINSFLDQLSLVIRNIQRIGPPFPLSLGQDKGAEN